jgi:hypothetical protein
MIRGLAKAILLATILLGSSCRNNGAGNKDRDCLPLPVKQIAGTGESASSPTGAQPPSERARLYIDGSGSMAGFAGASSGAETPFGDVIQSLSHWANTRRLEVVRLGDTYPVDLGVADSARLTAMQSPDFYLCRGPQAGPNCTFQQSRTQVALAAMADAPANGLSIFISDLWFSADEVRFDPAIKMREVLAAILRDRDVLIYGFKAPYGGALADLPSKAHDLRPARTPFYMIVAGPPGQMRAFHDRFKDSQSNWIRERLAAQGGSAAADELNFTLFSRRAPVTEAPQLGFAENDPRRGIREALPWREQRDAIPRQWTMGGDAKSHLIWDVGSKLAGYAAWQGEYEDRVTAWLVRDTGTCDREQEGRQVTDANSAPLRIELDPKQLREKLGRGTWLLSGEIVRKKLGGTDPATAWMGRWSFPGTAAGETRARQQMGTSNFFPTMNFADFAQLLQQAVDDANNEKKASADAESFAGFATVIAIH